jgi:hypothetical protein
MITKLLYLTIEQIKKEKENHQLSIMNMIQVKVYHMISIETEQEKDMQQRIDICTCNKLISDIFQ